jgi:hypothetical protein
MYPLDKNWSFFYETGGEIPYWLYIKKIRVSTNRQQKEKQTKQHKHFSGDTSSLICI